ncbi:Si-specific NAD(P)(+) transhydrogenase [Rubinisphaera italica]|uniref:Soluble pyridine nucleotide transhydrogenase n=1 Tax=Rubinisphaera italica TaxID=2527969 RepID=A0A5C5XAS1_9PLAN|nr:Si-specific NAD(P)(+) transhydrogenase [Rubinisphaera italica]TWT60080.1 Soluble pyridine nucleotide transhydrogenase [Rubinisphaera italica]
MYDYDVVVIGTGPGGEGAAMQAVKEGKNVCVVEKYKQIGGGCTHWGTIPSKALRHSIFRMTEFNSSSFTKDLGMTLKLGFPEMRRSAEAVIAKQVDMRQGFYNRNRVTLLFGHARFVDANTIEVCEEHGGCQLVTAASFVIATGSRPFQPPGVDFNDPRVYDSDTILKMNHTPTSVTIYGAGVIGCEYASMFRNLGCKVNLVNSRDKLLEFLDDEIIDALSYHLRERGVLIRHREVFERVETREDGAILHLQSGKMLKTDCLLWAAGRQGNTNEMGLETIDLTPNKRGQIEVNEDFQTKLPHIYAVGDVIGPPSLASAAYVQGRYAASHMIDGHADKAMIRDIPSGIYTSPEISSLGQTERDLTEACIPYEVGHSMFKSIARAQITGQTVGMLKLLFHRDTLEILGIHCFGFNATEIIHIGQAIMSQQGTANSLKYFMNTTFNYPTMAEAYRVAALNGYNRLF